MKIKLSFSEVKSFLIIAFGLAIYSFGVTAFLIPLKMMGGGVSGIGILLYYATNGAIPVGYSFFAINIVLIIIALKVLGPKFGIKTIFGIICGSVFLAVFQDIFTSPMVDEKFMSAIIGGALGGAGIGIAISQGGSSGGTDIIAMVINKYRNISPGRIILYIDVFIIASSYIVFHNIQNIVYGYVIMGITAYAVDMMISGTKQSAQLFIISEKYNDVAERIGKETGRGISIIDSKGWYSGAERKILMVVVRKHETQYIFKMIKEIDPHAFISMGSVMGVYGLGFEEIRS